MSNAPDSVGNVGYDKCPPGYVYVRPHTDKNHTFVKGYCRKRSKNEIREMRKEKVIAPYSQFDYQPLRDYDEIVEMENENQDPYSPETDSN